MDNHTQLYTKEAISPGEGLGAGGGPQGQRSFPVTVGERGFSRHQGAGAPAEKTAGTKAGVGRGPDCGRDPNAKCSGQGRWEGGGVLLEAAFAARGHLGAALTPSLWGCRTDGHLPADGGTGPPGTTWALCAVW